MSSFNIVEEVGEKFDLVSAILLCFLFFFIYEKLKQVEVDITI